MQSYPSTRASSRVRSLSNGVQVSTSPIATRKSDLESTPVGPEAHAAIHIGRCALITGAASGIGFALAKELAGHGLRIVLADIHEDDLKLAQEEIADIAGPQNVLAVKADVSKIEEVIKLRDQVFETFGEVNLLFNNAGINDHGGSLSNPENWRKVMDVNLFGVLNMVQTFVPSMIHQENPSLIVNTGSKQGTTNPPGNAAYNASKAGVRILTENLAHDLRNADSKVTAHLFIPGWVYTKLTGAITADGLGEKPRGAATAEDTVRFMLEKVKEGKFYIICPDNETSEDLDRLRIKWAAGDLVEGRPALSRWHPDWKPAYEQYIESGLSHFEERRHEKERTHHMPNPLADNL
ncbi:hypothetical protein FRB94_012226 [Tulasnella sp. JGI-2019a]|nr:hypothetical protein FRB93_010437 [Tulasnella sp. JGI-2019a]KAG8991806.1 hypothetical protein FRB94_012226 [Tulasnella sp. JGI-2019a]KAG9023932.1 hypothetical protein FRB95_012303 [Tulasnella sp. JGI-2019a]